MHIDGRKNIPKDPPSAKHIYITKQIGETEYDNIFYTLAYRKAVLKINIYKK